MLEMVQQRFDEDGNPTQQLVCGSEFAEELKKHETEWNQDKEFQAKLSWFSVKRSFPVYV